MSSVALKVWKGAASLALDEIVAAHRAVGGAGPGRRFATREINHAYAVLLTSQFQRFCRDLHTESVDVLVATIPSPEIAGVIRMQMVEARKLDQGNPNPGNLGSDFGRLGLRFWAQVTSRDSRNSARQALLGDLAHWRNAIAHHDFTSRALQPTRINLHDVERWRSALNGLARSFDRAVAAHLHQLVGRPPW